LTIITGLAGYKIFNGDCRDVMKQFPDNSFDGVVTDPPAGIAFMNASWDKDKGGRIHWINWMTGVMQEVYRVAKPGAHILVWALPRTSHWTATGIEDAGFEIRDIVDHVFGTGFPKSLDISKAIDKAAGAEREVIGEGKYFNRQPNGLASCNITGFSSEIGERHGSNGYITAPATTEAKQWDGWGTALKPAKEHWILARKPLSEKTVAANVLKWGTAGLNIDGCRICTTDKLGGGMLKGTNPASDGWDRPWRHNPEAAKIKALETIEKVVKAEQLGRYPANIIFDEAAARELDEVVGIRKSGKPGTIRLGVNTSSVYHAECRKPGTPMTGFGDMGGASRFFYCAKASKADRAGSKHPTIKPLNLIRYLCRLITPPGGIVLDPFGGSGTTLQAAQEEGFGVVVIEKEMEYCNDILNRAMMLK